MKFTLICNPENRRATYFDEACERLGLPSPEVVSWETLLGAETIPEFSTDAIRIESPGENWIVERRLIERGGGPLGLAEDHGRVRCQVPWFRGWQTTLDEIAARNQSIRFMNEPAEIAAMFDKPVAQERLARAGVPVPQFLCAVESFAQLRDVMESNRVRRVFLKPSHSSSASGIVALQLASDGRAIAITPAEMERDPVTDELRLYNSLRLRTYRDLGEIAALVDALAAERLFAERWFPKGSIDHRTFDLRVLVIGGRTRHVVIRTSQSPITNLHLGNSRGDAGAVKAKLGEAGWDRAMGICQSAAGCFPGCHYVAVDLMIGTDFSRFAVAEVNAFGDLIPNVTSEGDDTYTAELRSFLDAQPG